MIRESICGYIAQRRENSYYLFMETDNVVFIESGSKPPGADSKRIFKECNARAESIFQRYEITPSKKIQQVVDLTYDKLVEFMSRSGIVIKKDDIPRPIFLDYNNREPLGCDLKNAGFPSDIGTEGEYDRLRGRRPLIILGHENNNLLAIAETAFHEAYHSIDQEICTVDYRPEIIFLDIRRGGFTVFKHMNEKCDKDTHILEEAICAYDTARCIEEISSHPLLANIVQMKNKLVKKLVVDDEDKVSMPDGRKLSAKYFSFGKPGISFSRGHIIIQKHAYLGFGKTTISGTMLEKLLSRFPSDKKEDFLSLLRKARLDYRLIKDVAHKLEQVWGKGTYARILETEYQVEDLWKLYDELETKNSKT